MNCIKCNTPRTLVIDCRQIHKGKGTRRRRECRSCGHRWTTYEIYDVEDLKAIGFKSAEQDYAFRLKQIKLLADVTPKPAFDRRPRLQRTLS